MAIEEILSDYEDLEPDDLPRYTSLATQPDKAHRANCGMKFLIDGQLPRRLAHQLRAAGFEQFIHSIAFCKAIGPILISRETGAVYHCGTSAPLEERI